MIVSLKTLGLSFAALGFALSPAIAQMSHGGMDHGSGGHVQMDHDRSAHMVEGIGTVVAVDLEGQRVGLDHAPVPELKWPAMRMAFKAGDGIDLAAFAPGDRVQFTLNRVDRGAFPIVELCARTADVVVAGLCAPQMDMPASTAAPSGE